jgi:hypothetical protein
LGYIFWEKLSPINFAILSNKKLSPTPKETPKMAELCQMLSLWLLSD